MLTALRTKPGASAATHDDDDPSTGAAVADVLARAVARSPDTLSTSTASAGGGSLWAVQYHPEYDLHELARLVHCRTQKLIGYSFFVDEADAAAYIEKLEALHEDPTRKDLAWQLGIDSDVMNSDVRTIEVRNWIEQLVLPNMR